MHDSNDSEAQACYSDDFISDEDDYDDDDDGDDEIEEDLEVNSMDKSTKKKDTERMENNRPASSGLFKSVRFSDTSDDDDEDNSRQPRSNKVIQLNLSSKNAQVIFVVVVSIVTYWLDLMFVFDFKLLRQSIDAMSSSMDNDTSSNSARRNQDTKNSVAKKANEQSRSALLDNIDEEEDLESESTLKEASIVDLILEKAACLKQKYKLQF